MVHLTTALDASSSMPLYEQLYRSLAGEMRTGALPAGTRMPGSSAVVKWTMIVSSSFCRMPN